MLKGLNSSDSLLDSLAMEGTHACPGAGPRGEVGAPGGIASTPHMNTWGERLRSPVPHAGLLVAGRSAARQARIFEAVALCRSSLGRTFRPDMSKLEGDTLAFEGVIKPNFLSVTDEGRAERAGFRSGEPDIALGGGRLEIQGCTTIARANELVHSFLSET